MDWFNLDYLFSTFANISSRFKFDKMFSQVSDKSWHDDKKKLFYSSKWMQWCVRLLLHPVNSHNIEEVQRSRLTQKENVLA